MNIVSDIPVQQQIDELAYVDRDIADRFKDRGGWLIGLPTQMQLIREINLLRVAMQAPDPNELNKDTDKKAEKRREELQGA